MHLDCRNYPKGHHFAEIVSNGLGLYVKVANFVEHNGQRMFRMIVDPEIDKKQLRNLLFSTIKDDQGSYEFALLETIPGPVMDTARHASLMTSYLRITFMKLG